MKKAIIFGDSYSTFSGYIPDGYAVYYGKDIIRECGVNRVEDTWWYPLITETNSTLIQNNSWSGSPVCYAGYNNSDCSESSSFLYRFDKLARDGFFKDKQIDTVFVFGGTNDSAAKTHIGELKYGNFSKEELYTVLPAFCYLFGRIKEELPEAKIICILNTHLNSAITDGVTEACKHYGVHAVKLHDIEKRTGHPNVEGMAAIKEQILTSFNKN